MARDTVEQYLKLDTADLNRFGLFDNDWSRGGLNWGESSSIDYQIKTVNGRKEMTLSYTHKPYWEDRKYELDYLVKLTTTPCNFGGVRYWFLCPKCIKRVRCLYGGKYFLCRNCHDLSYDSCNETKGRFYFVGKMMDKAEAAEELYNDTRWQTHYDGRPTKRFLKYLRLSGQSREFGDKWMVEHDRRFSDR